MVTLLKDDGWLVLHDPELTNTVIKANMSISHGYNRDEPLVIIRKVQQDLYRTVRFDTEGLIPVPDDGENAVGFRFVPGEDSEQPDILRPGQRMVLQLLRDKQDRDIQRFQFHQPGRFCGGNAVGDDEVGMQGHDPFVIGICVIPYII